MLFKEKTLTYELRNENTNIKVYRNKIVPQLHGRQPPTLLDPIKSLCDVRVDYTRTVSTVDGSDKELDYHTRVRAAPVKGPHPQPWKKISNEEVIVFSAPMLHACISEFLRAAYFRMLLLDGKRCTLTSDAMVHASLPYI